MSLIEKYASDFSCLRAKLLQDSEEFDNSPLKAEVKEFLASFIEPAIEFKILSYITSEVKKFVDEFDVIFWDCSNGEMFGLNDTDFAYSDKANKRIFQFVSSDDTDLIYKYIKHFAKDFKISISDYDFEGAKCLRAFVKF